MIVIVVVGVFFALAYLRSRSGGVDATTGAHAPAMTFTGTYADDWQANCGAKAVAEQAECTTRLDAHYGRVAGAPVPKAP